MDTANHIEREQTRWMLLIFDILFYAVAFFATLFINGLFSVWDQKGYTFIIQFFVSLFCVTLLRFIFRIYHMVLRTGSVAVFSRLIVADLLSGIAYCLIQRFLFPHVFTFAQVFTFIGLGFGISFFARIVYYYLYINAQKNTRLGRFIERFLRILFRVDMSSDNPGAIVPFGEKVIVTDAINEVQRIIRQFNINGHVTKITKINKGYVNRTYHISTMSDAGHEHNYLLQRLNSKAFTDIDKLMSNYIKVTSLLEKDFILPGGKPNVSSKLIRTTKTGESYFHDDSGYWRMLSFYNNVYSLDLPDSTETFYYSGIAFGTFLKKMAELSPDEIAVVIPDFHDTYKRYLRLEEVIRADTDNRVQNALGEINFIRERKDKLGLITNALREGKIPTRICHNDCNLNNILFDCDNHKPVAVIDLDTVMPSSPLCDFGDSMRIGTNRTKDDEKDLTKVSCDLNLYEAYARGYLEACGNILTEEELKLLPYSSIIITMEDGIRFLTDYLEGDVYYNIFYANQNLFRSRTQLKLAEDMERKLPQIKTILQDIYDKLGLKATID